MFTGLIRTLGVIITKNQSDQGNLKLTIEIPDIELENGDSVAINGACLTVANRDKQLYEFDLSESTVCSTNFKYLTAGIKVHCEPALRAKDPLGGHLVTGHIDGVVPVIEKQFEGTSLRMVFAMSNLMENYIDLLPKGSVTVNGVSLTIQALAADCFTVVLIPETLRNTNFSSLNVNDWANIEFDVISKMVRHHLKALQTAHAAT